MDMEINRTAHRVDGNIVTIAVERIVNNFKSEQEGIPVYEDIPFIRIVTPSAKNQEVHTKVTEEHKVTYKKVWDQFNAKEKHKSNGTALKQWPDIEPGLIPQYEFMNVFTLEDLISVSDVNLENLGMGAGGLQEKAKIFLANKGKGDVELAKANDRIADLEKKLVELMDTVSVNPDVLKETQDELTNNSTRNTKRNRRV
tara:strand:- start:595 stop:1191 length:597 start_codon:yes stop_codon:yes gene_type:complete